MALFDTSVQWGSNRILTSILCQQHHRLQTSLFWVRVIAAHSLRVTCTICHNYQISAYIERESQSVHRGREEICHNRAWLRKPTAAKSNTCTTQLSHQSVDYFNLGFTLSQRWEITLIHHILISTVKYFSQYGVFQLQLFKHSQQQSTNKLACGSVEQ